MKRNELAFSIAGTAIILLALTYIYNMLPQMNFSMQDDRWMLLRYSNVHPEHYSFAWLKSVFITYNENQYSPVNTLYFAAIYLINGFDPYYYHLFPVCLHIINVMLVFLLAKEIFLSFKINNWQLNAYLVCLLWAIHPLNVETVIWVCGSKILICSLCCLWSFLLFIKAVQKNSFLRYALAVLLFLAGCFTKEQAMVTPIMLVLYMWCLRLHNRQQLLKWEPWYWCILVMMLINIPVVVITEHANAIGKFTPIANYPMLQRIILSFYCLSFYVTNQVVPVKLHYHYPFPVLPEDPMPLTFYLYPVCFTVFMVLLWVFLRHDRYRNFYLFGIGTFFIQILLVLQVIPMTRPAIMADRYMYMSSFALMVILLPPFINGVLLKMADTRNRYFLQVMMAIYIVCFTVYSHELASRWILYNLIKS
jgi:protein O-mannosyl-transferase